MENQEKNFSIACSQTGVIIETFATLDQAKNTLNEFEKQDTKDGIYELDFYEIIFLGELINY
jgi:hypothetical protein